MTSAKFITEERLLRNTYLHENRIFTNKVRCSIVWGGNRKDIVRLIKSLINAIV